MRLCGKTRKLLSAYCDGELDGEQTERVRAHVGLPVGVGFGISSPEQAVEVAAYADLVVVGSALVRTVHEAGKRDAAVACGRFVGSLRKALDEAYGGNG